MPVDPDRARRVRGDIDRRRQPRPQIPTAFSRTASNGCAGENSRTAPPSAEDTCRINATTSPSLAPIGGPATIRPSANRNTVGDDPL